MKSILAVPLSSDRLWEFFFLLTAAYLLFLPALSHPQSRAVALGAGLLLLLFKTVPRESSAILGRPWWLFLGFLASSCLWSLSPGVTLQSAGFVFLGSLLFLMGRSREGQAQGRIEAAGLVLALAASLAALYQWFFG